jgi:hypothetical protein
MPSPTGHGTCQISFQFIPVRGISDRRSKERCALTQELSRSECPTGEKTGL